MKRIIKNVLTHDVPLPMCGRTRDDEASAFSVAGTREEGTGYENGGPEREGWDLLFESSIPGEYEVEYRPDGGARFWKKKAVRDPGWNPEPLAASAPGRDAM